jgi:hypothetical protein
MRAIRRRLSYANVVATLALLIAVAGGTAYAANTVFSSDIVDGEVKSVDIGTGEVRRPDIKDNQVNSAKIADGTLNGSDVADQGLNGIDILDSSVTSADLATNSVGAEEILDGAVSTTEVAESAINSFHLGTNSVGSAEVANGFLRGVDVGEAQFVDFTAALPAVTHGTCVSAAVTGLPNNARDHLVLTENTDTTRPWIFAVAAYSQTAQQMIIRRCNLSPTIDEPAGNHKFNLLVIDAQ